MAFSGSPTSRPKPRVALIAVHGVADQAPRSSATAMASLLLSLRGNDGATTRYSSFREVGVRLPARPLVTLADTPPADEAHRFARALHEQYDASDGSLETVRIEGRRLETPEHAECDVDVYEMHWADLSRPGNGVVRLLGDFYRILLHLPRLGVRALRDGGVDTAWWRRGAALHTRAVELLTGPIVALHMVLAVVAMLAAVASLSATTALAVSVFVSAGVTSAAHGAWIWRRSGGVLDLSSLVATAISTVAVSVTAWTLGLNPAVGPHHVLAIECLALGAAAILLFALPMIERVLGHLTGWRMIVSAGLVGTGFLLLRAAPNATGVRDTAFWSAEIVIGIMLVTWIAVATMALAAMAIAWRSARAAKAADGDQKRELRLARLARVSFGVPATLMLVTTMLIWSVVASLTIPGIDPAARYVLHLSWPALPVRAEAREVVRALLTAGATPFFPWLMIIAVGTLALSVWIMAPVAWAEIGTAGSTDNDARKLGSWLTRGLRYIGRATDVAIVAVLAGTIVGAIAALPLPRALDGIAALDLLNRWAIASVTPARALIDALVALLGVGAVGVAALGTRLGAVADACRPALDIALDVDNYLRERPAHDTVRARISERFVSLVRYVCSRRDETGAHYTAIVLVTHSQGTAISADLLRLLRAERRAAEARGTPYEPMLWRIGCGTAPPDDAGGPIPLFLLTMGSPLRQIYAEVFPQLYGWVDIDAAAPDPTPLGVAQWVNIFATGDYVGRALWPSPAGSLVTQGRYEWTDTLGMRREICLGAGAHTHYWSPGAHIVAEELDRVIRSIAGGIIIGSPERRRWPKLVRD